MSDIKKESINGAKWLMLQKLCMTPVQFVVGVILARLISPHDMGILGLTVIFFAVASNLKDCGFGSALIRKQNRSEADCSTMFWFNIVASFFLSATLFIAAPYLADWYREPALTALTRVSAFMMFLDATLSVHNTLYTARRDFRTPTLVSFICTLISIPFTLWAAFAGWSYWAVVLQGIIKNSLTLIIIWYISPWKPRFLFSWASFKELFGFGSKLCLDSLIGTIYGNSRSFIVGKVYSPADMAFFSKGFQNCSLPAQLVLDPLTTVIYPVLSTLQEDRERLLSVYHRYTQIASMLALWLMLCFAANSNSIFLILYGEIWLPCALFAQIHCLRLILEKINLVNDTLCKVLGRSDVIVRRSTIVRIFGLATAFAAVYHSVAAVAWAGVLTAALEYLYCIISTRKVFGIKLREQWRDTSPYVLMALLANAPAFYLNTLSFPPLATLLLGGFSSLGLYALMLYLRRDVPAAKLLELAKESRYTRYFLKKTKADA